MQPLDKTLRNRLERTIRDARDIAEKAARVALEHLGVGEATPYAHLSEQDRELRRRLRVHGRQLGDSLNGGKVQTMECLVDEVAYEHWHRMLFARFLAENNLLMYPDPDEPVAVSLEECEDLAADEGAANGWELAARFAARMLPQIFRHSSPVFELVLPPEHQQKLEHLVADLPLEVFTASDSLGWVYQFWQAKRKDQVNDSEVKIGARELPAVTQLFTEPYMVSFLLDNSLGAWWAARCLSETDLQNAASEEELRRKASLPGVPLEYLRFVQEEDREGNQQWTPAAGTFGRWPEQLADLKALDPCCGSGHFLVAAFLMLVPMRMERDGLSPREAVDAVLRENIHGLELDQRCVELAAFALAFTAWKYPGAGGYRALPELNVACAGLSISAKKENWLVLAEDNIKLLIALEELYEQFKDAPILGSLINPEASLGMESLLELKWEEVSPLLTKALDDEKDDEKTEMAVVAQGLAKAATLLVGQYHWVITNVPYLARGKQDEKLRDFCERNYSAAKNDLATVFLERCLEFCIQGGTASVVLPQNWLFLTTYKKFREKLLKKDTWNLLARLGSGAFETISGEVVKAILLDISHGNLASELDGLFGSASGGHLLCGLDVSEPRTAAEKADQLLTAEIRSVEQAKQLENPDARVAFDNIEQVALLSNFAQYGKGSTTGDSLRYLRYIWEFIGIDERHVPWLNSPNGISPWSGRSQLCRVPLDDIELNQQLGCRLHGQDVWGTPGVVVNKMRNLESFYYNGEVFDDNICPISTISKNIITAICSYVESSDFHDNVRAVDQALKVTAATITKVPFDLDHWTKVAAEKYPNGLPRPYTDDPTQWIFHGHPCASVIWDEGAKWTAHGPLRADDTVLQVAVARLLGYRWPAELDPNMELADEQRQWVNRCQELVSYADGDGIVCIPPVRGEASAADRLFGLLAAAHKQVVSDQFSVVSKTEGDSSPSTDHPPFEPLSDWLSKLLAAVEHSGKSLESWLRERFFTQHCKLFQHRPFIWHIWDGLPDGFAALVNYHKLDAKLLETLTYTYLGDWISRQKQDITKGIDGAQSRLAAAEALKKKLELILQGEEPYDIFVRWKPLEQQPIGWNPDLNDGVRLNIRPFLTVPDVGKKGVGILRDKPNIKWDKDRGKDVETAPWYHLGPHYSGKEGDRINNHHLTLKEKLEARQEREALNEQ